MNRYVFNFSTPKHYSLFMTCHAHGWKYLAPFKWDDADQTISFAYLVDSQSVDINAKQNKKGVRVVVTAHKPLEKESLAHLRSAVKRSVSTDVDTSDLLTIAESINRKYALLVRKGAGRLLRSPCLWEDAAKTLFTTNCSWSLTEKISEAFCSERFSSPAPSGRFHFPAPETISAISAYKIIKTVPLGYRASYLKGLAKMFTDGLIPEFSSMPSSSEVAKAAQQIKGFGPYAATHIAVLSGHFDKLPVDCEVESYLSRIHNSKNPARFALKHYRSWGRYAWWGYKLERMANKVNRIGD